MKIIMKQDRILSQEEIKELEITNSPMCKCGDNGVFSLLPKDYVSKGRHMQCRICGMVIRIK